MNKLFLDSDKIYLRGVLETDLSLYKTWIDDPVVTYYMEMGWKPISDIELKNIYAEASDSNETVMFVIVDKKTNKPIGVTGLYLIQWICRRAQYRILIGDPDYWNKGVGAEATRLILKYAFERLNLEVVYLGVNADNIGAVRSYENAGFVHEGKQRKFVYRNGRYYDVLNMSVLREEYFNTGADES